MGRPSGTVTQEFGAKVAKLQKPAGVSYVFGGDAENQGDSFSTLGLALLISIVMVYLIMVALYDNYIYPFVVMFSIPLSIIGALLALALTNNTMNIFTILGMIMLIGLVAKNAIILVDFTNQMKEEGQSTYNALLHANKARLRPHPHDHHCDGDRDAADCAGYRRVASTKTVWPGSLSAV